MITPHTIATPIIKYWERLRLQTYLCPAGKLTIGWGHTKTAQPGMVITEAKAQELYDEDVSDALDTLKRYGMWQDLNAFQKACLLSMCFNLGTRMCKNSNGTFTGLQKAVTQRRYQDVPNEISRYVYSGGKKTSGLEKRRAAEVALWLVGSVVNKEGEEI